MFTMMKQQMSNAKMLQIKKKLIYAQSAMKNLFAENVAYLTKKYVDLIHVNLLVVILIKNIFVINVSKIFFFSILPRIKPWTIFQNSLWCPRIRLLLIVIPFNLRIWFRRYWYQIYWSRSSHRIHFYGWNDDCHRVKGSRIYEVCFHSSAYLLEV